MDPYCEKYPLSANADTALQGLLSAGYERYVVIPEGGSKPVLGFDRYALLHSA